MTWQQHDLSSLNRANTPKNYNSYMNYVKKPVEIYVFIDPFSEVCWSLQTFLKKLTMEYGRFFTFRTIVSNPLTVLENEKLNNKSALEAIAENSATYDIDEPWLTSLAIKAAELQGKRAGKNFLNRIQESLFLEKKNISNLDTLLECASEANIDMQEFEKDIFSTSAKRAYECDMRLTNEMNVDYFPTIVFFNQMVEEHGIKVSGLYPYEIYEQVLSDALQYQPIPSTKLPLEVFVNQYSIVSSKELAIIYDWPIERIKREMKKLQFKQKVEMISSDYGVYWKPKV
ncbi:ClpXP adapter SpxH family protein [Oceanobacillus sp. CAU 1775]